MVIALLALALGAAEIPDSDLVTQVDGKEVFAPAFRGHWASTAAACEAKDDGGIEITADHISGYEWDAVLLKSTPTIHQPHGRDAWAYTVVVLTASRSESDVDISKVRISRYGDKLYMSNVERVPEERHLTAEFANVRCQ